MAAKRFTELGMTHLEGGCHDKRKGLEALCEKWGTSPERVAFVADDLPDLPAFAVAGLKIAVKDAAVEVQTSADWILHAKGGHGAAREVCETLLKARGTWQSWLKKHS